MRVSTPKCIWEKHMSHSHHDNRVDQPATWELWEHVHDDGTSQLSFFPEWQENSRSGLNADAKLIWTVEASGYNDALRRYHDHMGWTPYKPIP